CGGMCGGRRTDSRNVSRLCCRAVSGDRKAMTPGALAAREKVQPPSMTRVIASLNDLGLVERTPHPTDGRQIIVDLSEPGRDLLRDEAQAREAWLTERLKQLDQNSLDTLRDAVVILTALVTDDK
ncbi:MarR family transcriptional regulator, partial [Rhodococcus phenolicus]|uniref:MarR family winged helix-turn-helix transcriptional regulator n=1 Tax=Rhodococcus phenolicus TaxID=263849 RepID=UPI0014713A93